MELYAHTPLMSIYWLPDVHAGYGIWIGMPRLEPTQEALAAAERLLVEKRSTRWISNTEEYIADWLQRMGRMKLLRAWADIPPKSATARLAVKNLGTGSMRNAITFAQFPSLAAAKLWIASK
jgi:hypothetical protein